MTDESQEQVLSDYEEEWGLDDGDDPQKESSTAEEGSQSPEEDTASSEDAPTDGEVTTPEDSTDDPAEGNEEDDVWANATPAQKEMLRRIENEKMSAITRAKLNADKLAERGRELKTLREKTRELEEATRPKTEFEQNHPEYAKEIEEMFARKYGQPVQTEEEPELDEADRELQAFDTITAAHPDAGHVYKSDSLQEMLSENPVFKHEGRAVLFSDLLHSERGEDVVVALDYFKANKPIPPAEEQEEELDEFQEPTTSQDRPDMRTKSQLSDREQYDAEWAEDDY